MLPKRRSQRRQLMAGHSQTQRILVRQVAPFAPLALALMMHSSSTGGVPSSKNAPVTKPAAAAAFVQSCASPDFPPNSSPTAIDETTCTVTGNGGAETWQNEAKNNFCAIGPAKLLTIPDLVNLQTKVQQQPSIPF